MSGYLTFETGSGTPVKAWVVGVPLEEGAKAQLLNVAQLPIIHGWVAAMPDVHLGYGATVGSVIPTVDAIIPAAVGVDIGCGMVAMRTTLRAEELPDDLKPMRTAMERAVPHGRTSPRKGRDVGSWGVTPDRVLKSWRGLDDGYREILRRHPSLDRGKSVEQLGTLGTGNHFIEVCLDEVNRVWVMLHSGSRGVGNRVGTHFIALARKDMERQNRQLPDRDLGYFEDGSEHFADYVFAVSWAQTYARKNRDIMLESVLAALRKLKGLPPFQTEKRAVNCHHNYVARETHYGRDVWVTRKGAVRAGEGELGIIPGSMGARSFIVRGKGNPESFHSCSHGAGRTMSRTAANKAFTLADHAAATRGVECRKDAGVLDETPAAYKDIDAVMKAQEDLVDVVHTLKQVVCVKG